MPEALPFMKGTAGMPSTENLLAYWNETLQRSMDLADFIQKRSEHFHRSITEGQQKRTSDTASKNWVQDTVDYLLDTGQRSVLFMDILRKRGNLFLETTQKGQRPVLTFDYKIIMDGKSLPRPVNHDLALIIPEKEVTIDPEKRPIVVVDPRAGHGPGIGGSKQDSEIGMALKHGHPVYFILFYPDPEAGQTYADVKDAQARFVEEVRIRHPHAEEPALIGNCQAGWAVALLSADRPDITGPLVLNGSPLSYWSGVDGQNPMRYRGGLIGGTWMTSLLCDLGNGKFDGANLVMNFEDLNPANTYWTKQYNVWSKVDTEEKRYLNFEKWWNSYFTMNAEEIHFIVTNLFVGNRLETGEIELQKGRKINLKNLQDPVLVFASKGDNITPPQQALNWIAKVYGSVDEIKRCQQVIVYRVHDKIGHLGIFVSGKVAQKEHKEFVEHIDNLDFLPPGLYELVIEEGEKIIEENGEEIRLTDFITRFEERDISDILALDDGFEDEAEFVTVAAVSEFNERAYQTSVRPWIRLWSNDATAEFMKWMHPMRVSRYLFSDSNPFMLPFKEMAAYVKDHRKPTDNSNPLTAMEQHASGHISAFWNLFRDVRDATDEFLFKSIYRNPWLLAAFPSASTEQHDSTSRSPEKMSEQEREIWIHKINKGGIQAGIVRVIASMAGADRVFDEREFEAAAKVVRESTRFEGMPLGEFKQLCKEQARILQIDEDRALNALTWLLPQQAHRKEAFAVAEKIAAADFVLVDEEKALLERLQKLLQIEVEENNPENEASSDAEVAAAEA